MTRRHNVLVGVARSCGAPARSVAFESTEAPTLPIGSRGVGNRWGFDCAGQTVHPADPREILGDRLPASVGGVAT